MPITMKNQVIKRAAEMAGSLVDEGYTIRIKVVMPATCFYKLRHKSNGSTITIIGTYSVGRVRLFKNGKLKKTEDLT